MTPVKGTKRDRDEDRGALGIKGSFQKRVIKSSELLSGDKPERRFWIVGKFLPVILHEVKVSCQRFCIGPKIHINDDAEG
jgi:hypothetical protein